MFMLFCFFLLGGGVDFMKGAWLLKYPGVSKEVEHDTCKVAINAT